MYWSEFLQLRDTSESSAGRSISNVGSRAVDGKRFLESNASSIPGTYFNLGLLG